MLGIYTYSYNDSGAWKDQLTGYRFQDYYKNDSFSGTITYDVMGNPLTYFNGKKNWNFIWKYGRQLASATDGTHTITNTYDVDGVRENKTVDGVEHKYVTLDGKIIRETYGTVTVDYFYDNEGRPYKLVVDEDNSTSGGSYTGYFVLNQQGDVIAILNANGAKVVSYEYNAWGQILSEDAAAEVTGALFLKYNALKYRGYYYDADLGLYYLESRFYDPAICRFINTDTTDVLMANPSSLTDKNLYAYCDNNPVNRIDENGDMWKEAISLSSGSALLTMSVVALKTLGSSVVAAISSITPAGWAVIGVVALAVVVVNVAPKVVTKIKEATYSTVKVRQMSKGGRQKIRDSGLTDLSDEEVSSRAHDNSLPSWERKRYKTEEKARGLRNKQKRKR